LEPEELGAALLEILNGTQARFSQTAFDKIMDAILGADPEAVREHQQARQSRKRERKIKR
jgi:hypothetical protein